MSVDDTIFHKIMRRELPAEIVYEDDQAVVFRDINPVSPTHLLVVPRKTLPGIAEAGEEDKELLGHMLLLCSKMAREHGIAEDGYRVVINSGEHGCQSVFQLHMHLVGGRHFHWPPG